MKFKAKNSFVNNELTVTAGEPTITSYEHDDTIFMSDDKNRSTIPLDPVTEKTLEIIEYLKMELAILLP